MNKILLAVLLMTPLYATAVEVSGNITYGTDYLWRGVSQKGDPALSAGVELSKDGWYTGLWASQVDYGDNSDYEYDVYTGWSKDINDELAVDLGLIQYNFNNEPGNKLEEWYAGVTFRGFSGYYYEDISNSNNHFAEYSYQLPIDLVTITFFYQDPLDTGGINISKDLDKYTISATYQQDRDEVSEAVMSVAYNF